MRPIAFNILRQPISACAPLRSELYRARFINRRFQSQIIYRPNGETLRRQNVYFKKSPMYKWRRIVTILMYGASVYLTLKYVPRLAGIEVSIESVLDDDEEEELGAKDEKKEEGIELTEKDLEAAGDSFFIPMTWLQKLPKSYYKGSDPEWQAFMKVANDKEQQKMIGAELVADFQRAASKHPGIWRPLGGEIKPGKYWLDILFPDGPPQEYVRSGLEFGDGFIAWSQERVQEDQQHRIWRALWPKAMFSSTLATFKTTITMHWQQISHALGLTTGEGAAYEQKFRAAAAMLNKANREREGLTEAHAHPNNSSQIQEMGSSGASTKPHEATDRSQKAAWYLPAVQLPKFFDLENPEHDTLRKAIALSTFMHTLAKGWHAEKMQPPKGTIVVLGVIELHGKNARAAFDVQGFYDPKQKKFVHIGSSPKYFQRWKQIPRGGN